MGNATSELDVSVPTSTINALKKSESTDDRTKVNISSSREIEFSPTEANPKIVSSDEALKANRRLIGNEDEAQVTRSRDVPANPAVLKLQRRSKHGSSDSMKMKGHLSRMQSTGSINDLFAESLKISSKYQTNEEQIKIPKPKDSDRTQSQYGNQLENSRIAILKKYRMTKFNSTSSLFVDFVLVNSNTNQYMK